MVQNSIYKHPFKNGEMNSNEEKIQPIVKSFQNIIYRTAINSTIQHQLKLVFTTVNSSIASLMIVKFNINIS